jgi:hypothetical protein
MLSVVPEHGGDLERSRLGRITANVSDSGLASRIGAAPPANRAAASSSMNANVIASEKPLASSARRTRPSRARRGSDGGGAWRTGGKVAGRCS